MTGYLQIYIQETLNLLQVGDMQASSSSLKIGGEKETHNFVEADANCLKIILIGTETQKLVG